MKLPKSKPKTEKNNSKQVQVKITLNKYKQKDTIVENKNNSTMMKQSFEDLVLNYAKASYPILVINTHEEKRVVYDLYETLKSRENFGKFYFWDSVKGILCENDTTFTPPKNSHEPAVLFDFLHKASERKEIKSVFILKDFHFELESKLHAKIYIRRIRQLVNFFRRDGNMLVFVSPEFTVPKELEKEVQVLEYAVPGEDKIRSSLKKAITDINKVLEEKKQDTVKLTSNIEDAAVEAAKGMTMDEIESTFALASVTTKGKFDKQFVEVIFHEKIAQVKKGNLLTYIPSDISFDNVGGLQGVKDWINVRKHAYSKKAHDFGIKNPKGILLAGVSGGL